MSATPPEPPQARRPCALIASSSRTARRDAHDGVAVPRRDEAAECRSFDLNGDGPPERLTVIAEVEKDYSVNLSTGERSRERFCWFSTRLEIRDERRRLIYVDNWAIKDDDMAALLEAHDATSPEDYFTRFGRRKGCFTTGPDTVPTSEAEIRPEAIEWALAAQGLTRLAPKQIERELSKLEVLRRFVYTGDWREDLQIVALVPSLRRAVAIQVGY